MEIKDIKTLEDIHNYLNNFLTDNDKIDLMTLPENKLIPTVHNTLGKYIRDNFIHGYGYRPLKEHFSKIHVFHPDDISTLIIESYYYKNLNKEYSIQKRIEQFHNHWVENNCDLYGKKIIRKIE